MTSKNARALRVNRTEAEIRLWQRLRDRQLAGAKFRRQTPEELIPDRDEPASSTPPHPNPLPRGERA